MRMVSETERAWNGVYKQLGYVECLSYHTVVQREEMEER